MMLSRRGVLGGGLVALLPFQPVDAAGIVDIRMQGNDAGSHVWFDPIGVLVKPGQTIRWTNLDDGNSHTATAYAPDNYDRPRRIPKGAKPWDSDFLLPKETFSITLTQPGVYDYYCIPHELAGMVGRIIVGAPSAHGWLDVAGSEGDLPESALKAFPSIEEIMRKGLVRRT